MTTIAVVGTGTMGRGIMQWAALAGARVLAWDARPQAAQEAKSHIAGIVERLVEKGRLTAAEAAAGLDRLHPVAELAQIAPAGIVIEAILENLAAKRAIFSQIEAVADQEAILCTNTSSLSVTACAAGCLHPERIMGLHFFNPVPLMKVVELVRAERTDPDAVERLRAFVATTGHQAVVCHDSPGFVVNHTGRGLYTEGLRIVQEGVATPQDVDRVMREAAGFPMGPFELFDLTGLDVSGQVLREIYDAFFQDPRYRPSPMVYRRMEAGLFGRKNGEGFYKYHRNVRVEPEEPGAADTAPAQRISVHAADTALEPLLATVRTACPGLAPPASGPEAADVHLVAPIGDDATTATLARGLDPRRAIAVDTLLPATLGPKGRATVMPTPVTDPALRDNFVRLLRGAGMRVTAIADSPGFISQRVLAMIVNTGCEIAQQRIARPADIETGATRGLGYRRGPLALGDEIGPARVLHILTRLQEITGDPRYRPSLWLRRRALLEQSLTLEE